MLGGFPCADANAVGNVNTAGERYWKIWGVCVCIPGVCMCGVCVCVCGELFEIRTTKQEGCFTGLL